MIKTTKSSAKALRTAALAFLAAAALSATSCGESREVKEQVSTAREMGRQRALELAADSIGSDTMLIESTLLDVREREHRLRSRGHGKVADSYIESFLITLDSVNPSLAKILK